LGFTSWFRSFWSKWSISDEADEFEDDEADELEEDEESDGSESIPYQPRDRSFKEKNKAFFEQANSFGTLQIHSISYSKMPLDFQGTFL
jgi:hypothetical protein